MAVSTEEMLKNIQIAVDLEQFRQSNKGEFLDEKPHVYLNRMREEKGLSVAEVCSKAGFDSSYCYRILSGTRTPGRDVLLHMTIAMGLDIDHTQQALRLFGLARLDVRSYRDAAIIFAIQRGYSLTKTTELLLEIGEAEL